MTQQHTMEQNNNSRGTITVGFGTSLQREIEIVDFIQAEYADHRIASISTLDDGSMIAAVENLASTGSNTQSTIWLTKESLIAVISTAIIYFKTKGEDIGVLLENAVKGNEINLTCSDNLTPKL